MTRAASPVYAGGYLTGSGLVADLGPLLPSQGCRLPSPDRGMKYDARSSSPTRKRRRFPQRNLSTRYLSRLRKTLIEPLIGTPEGTCYLPLLVLVRLYSETDCS